MIFTYYHEASVLTNNIENTVYTEKFFTPNKFYYIFVLFVIQ